MSYTLCYIHKLSSSYFESNRDCFQGQKLVVVRAKRTSEHPLTMPTNRHTHRSGGSVVRAFAP